MRPASLGTDPPARVVPVAVPRRRALRLVERNALAYRRQWPMFLAGLAEPLLFLASIGIGVGALIGDVTVGERSVAFELFVAPGLLAAAAMNGAVFDTTFNFFVKLRYLRTYEAVLATPLQVRDVALGELLWALCRGGIYSAAFLAAMVALGLVPSPWAVLALPAAVLVATAFAAAGLAAATFLRSFVDFDLVQLTIVPMFLFSATFFPLEQYPEAVGWLVRVTPLYQGVELCRSLVLGDVRASLLVHVAYLGALAVVAIRIANRRLLRTLTA
jgi:lipooligosaccharide transport system permease protein